MYNLNGIIHGVAAMTILLILIGIFLLFLSFCGNKKSSSKENEKKIKRERITNRIVGILCFCFAIYYFASTMYTYHHPQIDYHEGYYVKEHRYRGYPPLQFSYYFTDTEDSLECFYLDVYTKKEIYNEDFSTDTKYRIYYEKSTEIIVKVEVIEPDEEEQIEDAGSLPSSQASI